MSEDRVRFALTEPERKAVVMTLRARMRTEAGTFHELLRRAVEQMEPSSRSRAYTFRDGLLIGAVSAFILGLIVGGLLCLWGGWTW